MAFYYRIIKCNHFLNIRDCSYIFKPNQKPKIEVRAFLGDDQNMVKFCPKCEGILRKKIDGSAAYLSCRNCGFKEILHENIQITRKFALDNDPLNAKEDLEELSANKSDSKSITINNERASNFKHDIMDKNSSKESKFSTKASSKPFVTVENRLTKIEQELLLFEIKKNNLIKSLDSYENGPKQEELIIEILNYLIRIQYLKIQRFNHLQKHGNPIEQDSQEHPQKSAGSPNSDKIELANNEKKEEGKTSASSLTLVRSSPMSQTWLTQIREEFAKTHPELILIKQKYWASFETEMEHWVVGYMLPLRSKIWIVTCMNDSTKEKIIPQINCVDADEKVKLATAFLNKSMRVLQAHFPSQ